MAVMTATKTSHNKMRPSNARQSLPIWRDTNRLLVLVETNVKGFSRYHKYSIGQELRSQARSLCRIISHALRTNKHQRHKVIQTLILAVDDFKILLPLGKEAKASQNFKTFQAMVEMAVSIGKQGRAWLHHQQTNAQQLSASSHFLWCQVRLAHITEQGDLANGLKQRAVSRIWINKGVTLCY